MRYVTYYYTDDYYTKTTTDVVIDDLVQTVTVEEGTIDVITFELVVHSLSQAQGLLESTLIKELTLLVGNLVQTNTLPEVSISLILELTAGNMNQDQKLDSSILVRILSLLVDDIAQSQKILGVSVGKIHSIEVGDLKQEQGTLSSNIVVVTTENCPFITMVLKDNEIQISMEPKRW